MKKSSLEMAIENEHKAAQISASKAVEDLKKSVWDSVSDALRDKIQYFNNRINNEKLMIEFYENQRKGKI
jgi:hypothetical protein